MNADQKIGNSLTTKDTKEHKGDRVIGKHVCHRGKSENPFSTKERKVNRENINLRKIYPDECGSENRKPFNTKDTKEHKGEYEAWRQPEMHAGPLHPTESFLQELAFVFPGVLWRPGPTI